MAQLELYHDRFTALGASLVYIAAEKRGRFFRPEQYLAKHPVSFPFLLDEDRSVTRAYGVYHRMGTDAFNIARPATFVLDRDGVLRFRYVAADQRDRAPIEQVLKALQGLQS